MNGISKNRINRLIFRYVLEICLLILFLVLSFSTFTTTSLSTSASVAEHYSTTKQDLQVLYGRTTSNKESLLIYSNLLDRGELRIKNPNSTNINIIIIMLLDKGDLINLNSISINLDDIVIDLSKATEIEDKYEIVLESTNLEGYKNYKKTVSIYGNPLNTPKLDYTFKITESFYN